MFSPVGADSIPIASASAASFNKGYTKIHLSHAGTSTCFANFDITLYIVRRLEIDNHVQRANPYSEKSPGAIDSRETIKKVNMARIEDIPAQVRNQALKEMSRTELEAVINDMPKDVANKLTIENIRAIHNYNKR